MSIKTTIHTTTLFTPAFMKQSTVLGRSISIKADDYKTELVFSQQEKVGESKEWRVMATVPATVQKLYELGNTFFEPITRVIKRNLYLNGRSQYNKELPQDGVFLRAHVVLQDSYVLRCVIGFIEKDNMKQRYVKLQLHKAPSYEWLKEMMNLNKNKQDWPTNNMIFEWDLPSINPTIGVSNPTDALFFQELSEVLPDLKLSRNTTWQAHKSLIFEEKKANGQNQTGNSETEYKVTEVNQQAQTSPANSQTLSDTDLEEFPF